MKALSTYVFKHWLEAYGRASKENDARASAELFSPQARYYETPFDEPLMGREAIYQYWLKGAQRLKDKESSYEILAIRDNLGIAHWQSQFTVIASGNRVALDCLFLVEFNDNDKCSVFREWWHIQEIGNNPTSE